MFFFFQAEDGIRDIGVTGVETCALPISPEADLSLDAIGDAEALDASLRGLRRRGRHVQVGLLPEAPAVPMDLVIARELERSEERRVGKECRSRWSPDH